MAKNKRKQNKKPSFRKGGVSKPSLRHEFTEEFDVRGDKINDLSWYSSKTQELGVAATTNFLVRAGRKTDFGPDGLRNHSFPGICSIFLSPAFGINRSSVDPANVCAQNLYTYVRSANSGSRNYDAIDLFIYYGAVTQLYSWISYVKRALHALDKYDAQNQFIPQGLLKAMNFDYNDLRANQASLEIYVNNVITRASSLAIPGDIDAIRRSIWVYENAYWDDSSTQSQLFVFNPRTILQYDLDEDGAGCLVEISGLKYGGETPANDVYADNGFVALCLDQEDSVAGSKDANWQLFGQLLTYENIVTVTEKLLGQIFYDQDIAIMSGDVLKAYGPERLFKLVPYTRGEIWNPIYDEVALSMIENTTLTGPLNNVALKQSVTKDYLEYDPYILLPRESTSDAYLGKRMLNFHKSQPTEADVIEATRLMVSCRSVGTDPDREGRFIANLSSCGAEIAEFALEWRFYYDDYGNVSISNVQQVITYTTPINTSASMNLGANVVIGESTITIPTADLNNAFTKAVAAVLKDVYEDAWPVFTIENFKHHPTILLTITADDASITGPTASDLIASSTITPEPNYKYTPVVDADVYSFVDKEWIDNLNRACVQGLFLLKF